MPLSDRLKGLLDWWQLRIQTNQKDNEVNDARININDSISPSVCVGDSNKERQ